MSSTRNSFSFFFLFTKKKKKKNDYSYDRMLPFNNHYIICHDMIPSVSVFHGVLSFPLFFFFFERGMRWRCVSFTQLLLYCGAYLANLFD